jgi:hypothetical protein
MVVTLVMCVTTLVPETPLVKSWEPRWVAALPSSPTLNPTEMLLFFVSSTLSSWLRTFFNN